MNYYNYFTDIEEHFVRRRGKHLYVSPLDWSLITTWRDSGVPLHVALRGIDIAMDSFYAKRHRSGRVSTLFYCHETVMAEYAQHMESRLGEESSKEGDSDKDPHPEKDEGPDRKTVLEFLAARISEIKSLRAKQSGKESERIDRIIFRLEEIGSNLESDNRLDYESLERDLGILDETLVSELRAVVSEEQMTEWKEEAKKELRIYRKRLPKETYQKILDNFLRGKLHRRFHVGELSLFHL